jgi:hypothetical protein
MSSLIHQVFHLNICMKYVYYYPPSELHMAYSYFYAINISPPFTHLFVQQICTCLYFGKSFSRAYEQRHLLYIAVEATREPVPHCTSPSHFLLHRLHTQVQSSAVPPLYVPSSSLFEAPPCKSSSRSPDEDVFPDNSASSEGGRLFVPLIVRALPRPILARVLSASPAQPSVFAYSISKPAGGRPNSSSCRHSSPE